jgi:hypothetical protein
MDAKEFRRRQRLMDISKGNPYENIKKLSAQETAELADWGGYTHPSLKSTPKAPKKTRPKKPRKTKKQKGAAREGFKKRQEKKQAAPSESHLD